jgi:hypothetical protein
MAQKKAEKPETVLFIVPGSGKKTSARDRKGGETHALRDWVPFMSKVKPIKFVDVEANFNEVIDQVGWIISDTKSKIAENVELDEITVSLGITGEGSIGIATAGVEASIALTFKPRTGP